MKKPLKEQAIENYTFTNNVQLGSAVEDCVFKNCTFEINEISETFFFCKFVNCHFKNTQFYWSLIFENEFLGCDFTKTIFAGATLTKSKFLECYFKSVIFKPDNLGGNCDLTGVVIRDCKAGKFISYNSEIDEDDEISSILVRKTVKILSLQHLKKLSFDP